MADQVVAVAWFVGDQLEQYEPQLAAVEHPPAFTALASAAAAATATAETVAKAMSEPATTAMHRVPSAATAAIHSYVKNHHFIP
jgi:hypothetical protein